jgi:hypothetical protein
MINSSLQSHDTLIPADPNIPTAQTAELHLKLDVSVTSGVHVCMDGCKSRFALLAAGAIKLGGGEKGAKHSTGVELHVRLRVCSTILHILLQRGRNLPSPLERTLFIQTCPGTQLLLPSPPDR